MNTAITKVIPFQMFLEVSFHHVVTQFYQLLHSKTTPISHTYFTENQSIQSALHSTYQESDHLLTAFKDTKVQEQGFPTVAEQQYLLEGLLQHRFLGLTNL